MRMTKCAKEYVIDRIMNDVPKVKHMTQAETLLRELCYEVMPEAIVKVAKDPHLTDQTTLMNGTEHLTQRCLSLRTQLGPIEIKGRTVRQGDLGGDHTILESFLRHDLDGLLAKFTDGTVMTAEAVVVNHRCTPVIAFIDQIATFTRPAGAQRNAMRRIGKETIKRQ